MIDMVQLSHPEATIILFTPPPVDPCRMEDRKADITEQYANAVVDVGQNKAVHVFDIHKHVKDIALTHYGNLDHCLRALLYDGLHFNTEGYNVRKSF